MLKFPYQEAVRALMWTATMTRPDIGCAIRAVARFCEQCRGLNMKAPRLGMFGAWVKDA